MSEHLLTCPICDGPATAMDNGGTDTGPAWIAGCVPCGLWMPAHYTNTEKEAAAAWNRRPLRIDDQITTDTERLNKLETILWSSKIGNGLVIYPSLNAKTRLASVCLQDLGDEDGSNLGEELTGLKSNLREAIDAL